VAAFDNNVYLIAGGRDKGCDFASIKDCIARHVRGVTLIGEAASRIQKEWAGAAPISLAGSLEGALEDVHRQVKRGDVVIFSPGCSSFDMFKNFEHRGQVFKDLVNQLHAKRTDSHA
jgi:UDP-N-acetylmuramoylalanine--D-glutamate ligase